MTPPNVGVTFSVQGQDPVLKAILELDSRLKALGATVPKVQAATGALGGAFSSLTNTLRTLGIAFGAAELIAFGKRSIEAADQIFELSKKTGIGAEQLSVLKFAAKQSSVDIEALTKGFRGLDKAIGEALSKGGDAAISFDRVGVSFKDLQTLAPLDLFRKVVDGLQKVPTAAERADIAIHLFGRAGLDLVPLLDELAGPGFDRMAEAAQKAGAVMSGQTTAAAHELSAAIERLGSTGQGVILKLLGDGTEGGASRTIDQLSKLVALLGDLFDFLNKLDPDKLPWKSGKVNDFFSRLFSREVLTGQVPIGSVFAAPPTPAANILAGAGAAAPTRTGTAGTEPYSKAEIEDLAKLIELGAATSAERARALVIEKQIHAELLAGPLTLTRHKELAEELTTLVAAREKHEKAITDEIGKQATEREASAARERLLAIEKARIEAQAFEDLQSRDRLIAALGAKGFSDFTDLFARGKQAQVFQAAALGTLPEAVPRSQAEAQAAVLRQVLEAQKEVIDGNEEIGKSIRDTLARDFEEFFRGVADGFRGLADVIIRSIEGIASQLLSARLTSVLGSLLGLGIAAAPGGNWVAAAASAAAHAPGLAGGGWVGGSGSGDSVHAMLTPGEYVVNARSASAHADLLHAINHGPVPRHYALGGSVVRGGGTDFHGGGGARLGGSIGLGLEDGLVARAVALHLESDDGQRSMVNAVVRNAREVRDVLRDYLS